MNIYKCIHVKRSIIQQLSSLTLVYQNSIIEVRDNKEVYYTCNCIRFDELIYIFTHNKIYIINDKNRDYNAIQKANKTTVVVPATHYLGYICLQTYIFNCLKDTAVRLTLFNFIFEHNQISNFNSWLKETNKQLLHTITDKHFGHLLRDNFLHLSYFIKTYNIHCVWIDHRSMLYFSHDILKEFLAKDKATCAEITMFDYKKRKFYREFFLQRCYSLPTFFYRVHNTNHRSSALFNYVKKRYTPNKSMLLIAKYDYRCPVNQLDIFNNIIALLKPYIKKFIVQGYIKMLTSDKEVPLEVVKETNLIVNQLQEIHNDISIINISQTDIPTYANIVKDTCIYFSPIGSMQHVADVFVPNECIAICHGPYNTLSGYPGVRVLPSVFMTSKTPVKNRKPTDYKYTLDVENTAKYVLNVYLARIK